MLKRYFLVCSFRDWKDQEIAQFPGLGLQADKSMGVGYCPVYDSREDAEKHNPGRQVVEIKVTEAAKC